MTHSNVLSQALSHEYAVLCERVYAPYTILGDPLGMPRILRCYRYLLWERVYACAPYTIGWPRGCMRRTPLGDPWVCHVYYGTIGTPGEDSAHRTPLGDPRLYMPCTPWKIDRPIIIIILRWHHSGWVGYIHSTTIGWSIDAYIWPILYAVCIA